MTCPRVFIQCFQIRDNLCSVRVEMDIANQFRDQRSEVRGRRSEGQEQKTEVGDQMSEPQNE